MKAATGTASVEPAVGTATTHLAVDDDAAVPWAVALVAVLARHTGFHPGDVRKQGLDVASAGEVEGLLRAALLRMALAGLPRQSFRQGAVQVQAVVSRLLGELLCGLDRGVHGRLLLHVGHAHLALDLLVVDVGQPLPEVRMPLVVVGLAAIGEDAGGGTEADVGGQAGGGGMVLVVQIGIGIGVDLGVGRHVGVHDGLGGDGGELLGVHSVVVEDVGIVLVGGQAMGVMRNHLGADLLLDLLDVADLGSRDATAACWARGLGNPAAALAALGLHALDSAREGPVGVWF